MYLYIVDIYTLMCYSDSQEALQLEQRLHCGQLVAAKTAQLFRERDARRKSRSSEGPRRTPAPEPCPQR